MRRSPEIDAYLAPLPADQRAALQHLRETIAAAAPEAEESISYAMPAFRYRGRPVVTFLAAKKHLSLFPMGYHTELEKELEPFKALKGTLHFTPEAPIPDDLVTRLVKGRIAELDARPVARRR
ncbi:MAG: DUF1801 domain-containing protein [Chloroflexi bacterium]|nr:DUF1801 domain-containing protein [Chloroflexota bacterium]